MPQNPPARIARTKGACDSGANTLGEATDALLIFYKTWRSIEMTTVSKARVRAPSSLAPCTGFRKMSWTENPGLPTLVRLLGSGLCRWVQHVPDPLEFQAPSNIRQRNSAGVFRAQASNAPFMPVARDLPACNGHEVPRALPPGPCSTKICAKPESSRCQTLVAAKQPITVPAALRALVVQEIITSSFSSSLVWLRIGMIAHAPSLTLWFFTFPPSVFYTQAKAAGSLLNIRQQCPGPGCGSSWFPSLVTTCLV